jgi:large subunit ribosomal protein L13
MKTFSAKKETAEHNWYVVDATDKTLGRLAAAIAHRLRGKHKPEFTAHVDTGDYIVVINADKIQVTGTKRKTKMYHHHTGYTGALKSINFDDLMVKHPGEALKIAVKGMITRNPLGRDMMRKLKVYAGDQHPHAAQQPAQLTL